MCKLRYKKMKKKNFPPTDLKTQPGGIQKVRSLKFGDF